MPEKIINVLSALKAELEKEEEKKLQMFCDFLDELPEINIKTKFDNRDIKSFQTDFDKLQEEFEIEWAVLQSLFAKCECYV